MNYTDILHAIAEALQDNDNRALEDIQHGVQDLLITEDERAALEALINAALYSVAMATS